MLIHTIQIKQLQLFTNNYEEPSGLSTRNAHSLHTRLYMDFSSSFDPDPLAKAALSIHTRMVFT